MGTWTSIELGAIDASEELELASLRRDGSLGRRVTIWVVRVGDDLYVRSWKGLQAAWFRGTRVRQEGRIQAGGVEKDVAFVADGDERVNARVDAAYRTKYARHARWVPPMVTEPARGTTLKLVPRP
jgi:hypothetical protein